jgi:hypothetical protein
MTPSAPKAFQRTPPYPEQLDCYPETTVEVIKTLLDYRTASVPSAALKVFLGEDVPRKLVPFLTGHEIETIVSIETPAGIPNRG